MDTLLGMTECMIGDDLVQNVSLVMGGHLIQIVRHNYDDDNILVDVDNEAQIMPWNKVKGYVERCLKS